MHYRTCLILLTTLHIMTATKASAAEGQPTNDRKVRDYVAAYNERDIDAMLRMVTDDIQWISVDGDKISVETRGKKQLRESMAAYFKSSPTAKSELEWVQATRSRVAALERASWESKGGKRSQASLSVYEFRRGLISRVYYYPAEK
jgi:uncharacterized protein (TIGR02246 family)